MRTTVEARGMPTLFQHQYIFSGENNLRKRDEAYGNSVGKNISDVSVRLALRKGTSRNLVGGLLEGTDELADDRFSEDCVGLRGRVNAL